MQIVRHRGYARAGLIGNPSDGYHGKTISVLLKNYYAEVILYEWEDLELILSQEDRSRFASIQELQRDVTLHGYYGGVRLVKATIKTFVDYCERQGLKLHDRNFSVRYETNIPRQVGMAGSSAIIAATLRTLMEYYDVKIPIHIQPSLVLSVEMGELGITAGLQDRVIQVYGGVVYMDFGLATMRSEAGYVYGQYESLDPSLLPPLYVAFSDEQGEPTEVTHQPLRLRYEQGDRDVLAAMDEFARLTEDAKAALLARDPDQLSCLIDENFDTRLSICQVQPAHRQMVETARSVGASGKFAGSGGAIIGVYQDDAMYTDLKRALEAIGCTVFKPVIA
jgi:glucuronokinase